MSNENNQITINGMKINPPIMVEPKKGDIVYMVSLHREFNALCLKYDDEHLYHAFLRGILFKTYEDALALYFALVEPLFTELHRIKND